MNSYNILQVFTILILRLLIHVESKEYSNCVPVSECNIYLRLIQENSLTREMINLIREAHCGWKDRVEKVWCPDFTESLLDDSEELLNAVKMSIAGDSVLTRHGTAKEHLFPNVKECGKYVELLIRSKVTVLDEFPWSAMLLYQDINQTKTIPKCGGALISKRYVVTAAHCITSDLQYVVLGEHDTRTRSDCFNFGKNCAPVPLKLRIEQATQHPAYKPRYWNNIALLRLERDVDFNDFVAPICLPMKMTEQIKIGTNLTAIGWGAHGNSRNEVLSSIKLKVDLPVVSKTVCARRQRMDITDNMFCAGGIKEEDTCHGDAGGPLMFYNPNFLRWQLVGIVNFAKWPCGFVGMPAVYTWLPAYLPWIYQTVYE